MQSTATSVFVQAISNTDPSIRSGVIQVLGLSATSAPIDALIAATYDVDSDIRESSIWALGQIGALKALSRLQELQIVQSNFYVQQAAFLSEQQIQSRVAVELALGAQQVHAIVVAPECDRAFAVTTEGLFALRDLTWYRLDSLPAEPTQVVATDSRGETVFAGTTQGLFKSVDGGENWTLLQSAFPILSPVEVTAVTVDPRNSSVVFIALAAASPLSALPSNPIGIFASKDGGNSWEQLPESPHDFVTHRLALDLTRPNVLFGSTGAGTWQYSMPGNPLDWLVD